jgi:hypothetical protein
MQHKNLPDVKIIGKDTVIRSTQKDILSSYLNQYDEANDS